PAVGRARVEPRPPPGRDPDVAVGDPVLDGDGAVEPDLGPGGGDEVQPGPVLDLQLLVVRPAVDDDRVGGAGRPDGGADRAQRLVRGSLVVVVAVDRDVDGPWLVDGQELGQCLVLTPGGPPEPAGQPGDGEDDDGDRDGRTHHSATRRGAQLRALPLLPADLDHGRSYASR